MQPELVVINGRRVRQNLKAVEWMYKAASKTSSGFFFTPVNAANRGAVRSWRALGNNGASRSEAATGGAAGADESERREVS